MSQVKFLKVKVTRGAMTTLSVSVPQWEAQVLLALWGEEAEVVGEKVEQRKLPDVADEFTRLANKYGPRDEDVPTVAKVFGSFGPGLRALEAEFAASVVDSDGAGGPEDEAGEQSRGAGTGAEKGPQLPGSDQTFGPSATPRDNSAGEDFTDLLGEHDEAA